jgi:hypothetical protein
LQVNPIEGKLVSAVVAAAAADPGRFSVQQLSMVALAAGILQAPVSPEELQPFIEAMLGRTTASNAQVCVAIDKIFYIVITCVGPKDYKMYFICN